MFKALAVAVCSLYCTSLFAQNEMRQTSSGVQSEATIKVCKKKKHFKYFSENAPVTMADGTTKPIADVKVGEHVKTCKDGKGAVTQVKQIDVYTLPGSSLTALYLRPADQETSQTDPTVPALLLEATPHHRVQTHRGKKRMNKLSKNDILYHYEPSTGLVSTWKVGAVQQNARTVNKAYNLATEEGTYLVDNVMVANN